MKDKPKKKYQMSAKGTSSRAMGLPEWGLGLMPICFWGTAFYFVDVALRQGMHPGTIVWMRMTLGFIFFALLPIKSEKHSLGFHDWVNIVILGFVGLGLPLTLFATAQQWIVSSLTGLLVGAQPIFATVLASFFLKALPSRRNTLGLFLGLAGLVVTAWPSINESSETALGILLIFCALLCYAFSYNFSIPLTQKWGGYFVNVRMLFVTSILTMPYGIYGLFETTHTLESYYSIAVLGIGATAITPYAAALLGARVGATRASSVNFLIPLVALFMGAVIRHEGIHGLWLIGLALILTGVLSMGGVDTKHSST